MKTQWIVVAHRTEARIYELKGRDAGLKLIKQIDNPEGRLKVSQTEADKQGRTGQSSRVGQSSYSAEEGPKQHSLRKFANEVANVLNKSSHLKECDEISIIAEPQVLGAIRNELKPHTSAILKTTFSKDFCNIPDAEIERHVAETIGL